jgi:ABC-type transport system involved in cytochrome c biogenesis permease subunit
MSSTILPGDLSSGRKDGEAFPQELENSLMTAIRALASLKLTCVLFILAMFIVFVGSLAQARRDVWQVMAEYFRTYIAWIQVRDLFPPSMFGDQGDKIAESLGMFGKIPFPGGWTIGWIMLANLTAAHALKFRVRATGLRLAAGIGLIVVGLILTAGVVLTGNMQTGVEYGDTVLGPEQIWYLLLSVLGISGLAALATAVLAKTSSKLTRGVMLLIAVSLIGVLLYFVLGGEKARLNLSSMRILWQLLKGAACSLILLLGSNLLFEKRGGIALLHFGVAMLMISELQVGLLAKENMLSLVEGETSDFIRDIRERELAIITQKTDGKDQVIVIPEDRLQKAATAAPEKSDEAAISPPAPGQVISLPSLPFDVVVREFQRNSRLRGLIPGDKLRTDAGLGSFAAPERLEPVTGMDDSHDQSAIYIDVVSRDGGKVLHSMLVAQNVSELRGAPLAEKATVDGKDYYFYLRFQRNYRPYEVKLVDVSRTNYVGTATPRDYRSEIEITNPKDGSTDKFTLWMNNPLRYKGETFYQSGFQALEDGKEASTISVVNNTGWMLPYIACMIVSFGMFAQFGQTLFRFLDRTERIGRNAVEPLKNPFDGPIPQGIARPGFAPASVTATPSIELEKPSLVESVWIPLVITLTFAIGLGSMARPPKEVPETMNLYGFAQLPIAWSGRAQPIDSVARTQLLVTSHKSTFEGELEPAELSDPKQRAKILSKVQQAWPNVPITELEDFEGSYTEWIEKIATITSSGKDAVEARMRSVMVRRRPAVQWFLDVVSRPEVAARHRVIKIDDDQVLSLLGLEKRGGLTYSMVEIQKNIKELDAILQKARQKQRDKQENSLTTLERRVSGLFETVSRIDQLSQMFLTRKSDSLLSSYIDCWRILRLLGNEPAVMAVPTGSEDEQRSWETLVGANAVRQLNEQLKQNQLTTWDEFNAYMQNKLPQELVTKSVIGTYNILGGGVGDSQQKTTEGTIIRQRATDAISRLQDDRFLSEILKLISAAPPESTPEQIAAAVKPENAREIAADRISSELFEVFSVISESDPQDKRLMEIRTKLQQLGSDDGPALATAMNVELAKLVWDDLHKRATHLLPGGECSDTFDKTSGYVATLLKTWQDGDVDGFNTAVSSYREVLDSGNVPHVNMATVRKEAWFNFFEPFMQATYPYVTVIVFSFLGWLFFGTAFRRTSLFLLVLAFALHSLALLMRMQISGRPPVTNLYSSAIFIGWAVVIASFVVELVMKNGIGNILGASVGAGSLVIAHYLARDEGDTLGVMQAVLDTTFWLATHVVCITLGYAATFLAGFIGLFYCVQAVLGRSLAAGGNASTYATELKDCGKLVYGTLCFALFFSLVGTVLGGLWADDSWGRFWGWDPKENGAMLIVLWNALILHARWDKMVSDYGTAVLAMIGNIVTAWSWFGVNELKAGLHTYGFTEGRLLALGIFAGVQLAIIIGFAMTSKLAARRMLTTR